MMKCICCKNDLPDFFEKFEYIKNGKMNYPQEMDSCKIIYCNNCSYAFCHPSIDNRRLNLYYQKYYNGKSVKSDSHLNYSIIRNLFFDERSIAQISLINQFSNIENKNILDIGSGSALFFLQLNRIGFKNTNKYIIEPQVQNKKWYTANSINIIEQDIFKIDKKFYNYFDLIFMSHSLEHFNAKDADHIISLIYKLLKVNGKLFVEVPNADIKNYSNSNENMQPHLSFFTKKSISLLMKNKNFEIKYIGLFGESQKQKIPTLGKNKFYLNNDNFYIHINSEKSSNKLIKKRRILNIFIYILSFLLTKKIIIFFKDVFSLFINKKNLDMSKREFKINNIDGEFLRIICEKN